MCATCTLLRSWRIVKNVKYFEVKHFAKHF